jgi:formate--tetrahydrofolate ligase
MTDIEIAHNTKILDIKEVAQKIGLKDDDLIYYGKYKAKVTKLTTSKAKLILVTAINPTPYGEGKTTVSIGLGDALNKLDKKPVIVLRQPSMGPVFGMKGGATGGGYSQVVPMDDINLHFTGDFHAITAANDLLSAAIDNHIYQGNSLDIQEVTFKRCLDVNDRALRNVDLGSRKEIFTITAASEIMALFCLATSLTDLKIRIGNIVIGYNSKKEKIYAKDLKIDGAMTVLLRDAFYPNLVQTLEGTPTLIHGGPFANIAHGCNSVVATKLGLGLGNYVVTEAGFGADLGAEKFFDIKCRKADLKPDCVVLVATLKALKYNANVAKEDILKTNIKAVEAGLPNLETHIENLKKFGVNVIVCLNKYATDSEEEIAIVNKCCLKHNVLMEVSTAYLDGGTGAIDLAKKVIDICHKPNSFKLLYQDNLSIKDKIRIITKEIYQAGDIIYTDEALETIKRLEQDKLSNLPICVAKTQYSLSDDPKKLGSPKDYPITVREVYLYNGAEFITVLLGSIIQMPGLPKVPNYEKIDLDKDEQIIGIF